MDSLVSVVFPVFNSSEDFLNAALDSLLAQTYKNIEIIIVDDSDQETTIAIVDKYASQDERILVIRRTDGLGLTSALNLGIKRARGEYVLRADSDDIQSPDRVSRQLDYLFQNPNISVVGCATDLIDETGKHLLSRKYPLSTIAIEKESCLKNPIAHPTVLMRRDLFDTVGLYDETLSSCEDYELWMRCLRHGIEITNMRETLVKMRMPLSRDRNNWRTNLSVKVKYFESAYAFRRAVGIAMVTFFMFMPNKIKLNVYKLYNHSWRKS